MVRRRGEKKWTTATAVEQLNHTLPTPTRGDNGGLSQPRHNDGTPVTGATINVLRAENKYRRHRSQENQPPAEYWSAHTGKTTVATEVHEDTPPPHRNGMCPSGLAKHHPAFEMLLDYATGGCPVKTGRPWSKKEITAAVHRGPHESALSDEAIEHFRVEAEQKVAQGQARIIEWDTIKDDPPREMKVSPVAAIPHKSKAFWSILDLSISLKLEDDRCIPSVTKNTEKTAPGAACSQLGHSLQRVIHAFAQANDDAKIFGAKWDIQDGFWRMDGKEGEEFNFCYVLPQKPGEPVRLVVPSSL